MTPPSPLGRDVYERLASARHSVRDFLPDQVDLGVLENIVADGLLAPSWSSTRPYRVALATGATRDRISQALHERARDISRLRSNSALERIRARIVTGGRISPDTFVPRVYPPELRARQIELAKALFGHMGIARTDTVGREMFARRNYDFFGAPAVVFIFARQGMGHYSAVDIGHFMMSMMLSAQAQGIGTCAQGSLAHWSRPVRDEFDVPNHYDLLCGLSLGYPAPSAPINHFIAPRTPVDDIMIAPRRNS